MLESLKVLDLADENGLLCGRILADLGADVIKIEKPGGDKARNIGPFYHDIPDPEKSLFWFAYNLNKRSITLDIETADGRAIFKKLVEKADVIIESFPVGYMEKLGLSYPSLSEINPGLIMASISPFGQTGPYKDYRASDIVEMGMGGYLYLSGDPDTPPVRIGVPQAASHGGSEAAVAIMVALCDRDRSGEGQWVDVSIQQSLVMTTVQAVPFWFSSGIVLERCGVFRSGLSSGTLARQTWPCKNGFVNYIAMGGRSGLQTRTGIVKWMEEEQRPTEALREIVSPEWDVSSLTQEDWSRIEGAIGKFFLAHTKEELLQGGIARQVAICPLNSPADTLDYVQMKERNFWIDVEHPELGTTIRYPGFCTTFSETPCRVRRRPPLIGEHNIEVYENELGLSRETITTLKQARVI